MSILVANPCTSNASPKVYVAESVNDIYEIRNGKKGDLAIVASLSEFQIWRMFEDYTPSGAAVEGVDYIYAKPCGVWVISGVSGGGGSVGGVTGWFVVDALDDLRAVDGSAANKMARLIDPQPGENREWYWDNSSTAVDDGTSTAVAILPDNYDVGDNGRWLPW